MEFEINEHGELLRVHVSKKEEEVVIPDNVVSINSSAFSNCLHVQKIVIPPSVKIIKERAFAGVHLKDVVIPSSVEKIEPYAFRGCYFLEKVHMQAPLREISVGLFSDCEMLKEIILPDTINNISDNAFFDCSRLEEVKLPKEIKTIGNNAFEKCRTLKRIMLPNSVSFIGDAAFQECASLEYAEVPPGLIKINPFTFSKCSSLKSVEIPNSVRQIGYGAFNFCTGLEEVTIPSSLEKVGGNVFCYCRNIKKVTFLDGARVIGDDMFSMCKNLESVEIPGSVEDIGESAFAFCTNLKNIKLPKKIKNIKRTTFRGCKSLDKIAIPSSVEEIGEMAFFECNQLNYAIIPESVKIIQPMAFCLCPLENIEVGNFDHLFELGRSFVNLKNYYFNEETGKLILSKEPKNNLDNYKRLDYEYLKKFYKHCLDPMLAIISITFKEEEIEALGYLKEILPYLATNDITKNNYKEIKASFKNNKEFKALLNRINKLYNVYNDATMVYYDLYKLEYSLGAFSENPIERQRACEFISTVLAKGQIDFKDIHGMFESLKFKGFNKEWAAFLMDKKNFESLLELEKDQSGYLSRVYNSFSEIKEFGRSNKGSQRYRKVTIQMCEDYFSNVNFTGVNDSNIDVAQEITRYTHNQESFDEASKIRAQYLALRDMEKIKDHIVDIKVTSQVDSLRLDIVNNITGVLSDLNNVSNEKFTYEFLSKYDPKNFTLGKYCCCCAHLEGTGASIMKASILHPDCQNLVIKNDKGRIIAKSTLYVNRNQGYGVFNNVEIDKNVKEEDKELIYQRYMEAIDAFATVYNKKNPNRPIKQITVGMNLNDLSEQIRKNNRQSDRILIGMDFGKYGNYEGDWQGEQYVVWSIKKELKR